MKSRSNGVVLEQECPGCGEWIEYDDHMTVVTCPECQEQWMVDADAEFVNGHWRDLTKLIPVPVLAEPHTGPEPRSDARVSGEARESTLSENPVETRNGLPDSRGGDNSL